MKKIFTAIAILTIAASCSKYGAFSKKEEKPEIRIVDNSGNPQQVILKTPELNVDALQKQGKLTQDQIQNANPPLQKPVVAQNRYVENDDTPALTPTQRELANTLETPTQERGLDQENTEAVKGIAEQNMTNPELEYDLGKEDNKVATRSIETAPAATQTSETPKGIFVQAGSFKQEDHAKARMKLITRKTGLKNGQLMTADVNGATYHRVIFGPYKTKSQARLTLKKISKKGFQSIIIKNK